MNFSLPSTLSAPAISFSNCGFYEGYYMAFQDVGVLIVKVGLAFFVFDLLVQIFNRWLDERLEKLKT